MQCNMWRRSSETDKNLHQSSSIWRWAKLYWSKPGTGRATTRLQQGRLSWVSNVWDKEKIWVPDRNRTHDLPNTALAQGSPWVLVAQWIEHPLGVGEVMDSILVGDSDCFFAPRTCHVDQFTEREIHHLYLLINSSLVEKCTSDLEKDLSRS